MSRRPIVLLAASGLAREVLEAANSSGRTVVALLDDDENLHGTSVSRIPVTGSISSIVHHQDADLVICAGSGFARRAIARRLRNLGVGPDRFTAVIHPTASTGSSCIVGPGAIVLANVAATADVRIGAHVVVMPNAVLTHDCVAEEFVTICAGATLGGSVVLREGAYLGMNASVRQRLEVGPWAVLGMGSVLLTDLPGGATWAGVPAAAITSGNLDGAARSEPGRQHQSATEPSALILEKT